MRRGALLVFPLLTNCLEDLGTPPSSSDSDPIEATLFFIEVAEEAGLDARYELDNETLDEFDESVPVSQRALGRMAGGIAIADVDADSWFDVLILQGEAGAALFLNQQDGTFANVTDDYDLEVDVLATAPVFADFDGDTRPELLVGGVGSRKLQLFRNVGGTRFTDVTDSSGLTASQPVIGAAVGDADHDGDLDVLLARWGRFFPSDEPARPQRSELFWVNDGDATFVDRSELLLYPTEPAETDAGVAEVALTPNFADVDRDGDQDVLLVQDRGGSSVFENQRLDAGVPVFANVTVPGELTDERGMGAALGDYDNDGDLDWFVTSVYAPGDPPSSGYTGNRLYENDGNGSFRDVTERAGVRDGAWGRASCFEDFNNDGFLDLFHVNGWSYEEQDLDVEAFTNDTSRLFLNQRDGTFEEVSFEAGIEEASEGRGVACFDFDHDGDVDILTTSSGERVHLYGNTLNPWLTTGANYLCLTLLAGEFEAPAVGARVTLETGSLRQYREVRLPNGMISQGSSELHFGLRDATSVDRLRIEWPDGEESVVLDIPRVNSCLEIRRVD